MSFIRCLYCDQYVDTKTHFDTEGRCILTHTPQDETEERACKLELSDTIQLRPKPKIDRELEGRAMKLEIEDPGRPSQVRDNLELEGRVDKLEIPGHQAHDWKHRFRCERLYDPRVRVSLPPINRPKIKEKLPSLQIVTNDNLEPDEWRLETNSFVQGAHESWDTRYQDIIKALYGDEPNREDPDAM